MCIHKSVLTSWRDYHCLLPNCVLVICIWYNALLDSTTEIDCVLERGGDTSHFTDCYEKRPINI